MEATPAQPEPATSNQRQRRFPAPAWLLDAARRFTDSGAVPVPPKLASTVILLRPVGAGRAGETTQQPAGESARQPAGEAARQPADPADGFEVFAFRRAASMAFAAGLYAFPGGTVDPRDTTVVPAWAGPEPEAWAVRLRQDEATARAVVCAAVREVFEECGVLLAGPDESTVVGEVSGDDWEAARAALVTRKLGFAEFLAAQRLILRTDLLAPWARWVTPEFEPRRYDTYFFLARLPDGQDTRDVGGEAEAAVWATPGTLLAGDYPMLPPTTVNLRQLAKRTSVDDAWLAAATRDAAEPIMPRLDLERGLLEV